MFLLRGMDQDMQLSHPALTSYLIRELLGNHELKSRQTLIRLQKRNH